MKNLSVLVLNDHPFQRMVMSTALKTMVGGRIYEASAVSYTHLTLPTKA